ncbi:MAG TPA: hypothetical protein VHR47_10310 [Bacillota bacterium]|nr:hypothetical protein [Bacillota bacterium]
MFGSIERGNESIRKLWEAIGGRKFLGLLVATVLAWAGRLTSEAWVLVFFIFVLGNVFEKMLPQLMDLAGRWLGRGGHGDYHE